MSVIDCSGPDIAIFNLQGQAFRELPHPHDVLRTSIEFREIFNPSQYFISFYQKLAKHERTEADGSVIMWS